MIPAMFSREIDRHPIAPSPVTASVVSAFRVHRFASDGPLVAVPLPEIQIAVRFGPSAPNSLDVHVLGMQAVAHRKHIRRGQWAVTARLHIGASRAVLGVPASAVAGSIIELEALWGSERVRRLLERVAGAKDEIAAVEILDRALAERIAPEMARVEAMPLARRAAAKLESETVNAVAANLGISERHLRRVFREAVGVSPKAFARLSRFRRALRMAREEGRQEWAQIAAEAGYYDQSHLIEEFRAICGVTPRALLGELGMQD